MNRRVFIRFFLGIPLLGALLLFVSPLFRYLKPTAGPAPHGLVSPPDSPQRVRDISFALSDFPEPWVVKEFLFEQKNPEYTRQGAQISRIPGFALRIPSDTPGEYKFEIVSRICPHMGCIFRYVDDPEVIAEGFNYHSPKGTPMFACPCHLSVFDPLQKGKVVSGPAPRSPRVFTAKVDSQSQMLVITDVERGGIA
jgi:nitrite reductase/ring-hydroxylating ferredoxin subunit